MPILHPFPEEKELLHKLNELLALYREDDTHLKFQHVAAELNDRELEKLAAQFAQEDQDRYAKHGSKFPLALERREKLSTGEKGKRGKARKDRKGKVEGKKR